MKTKLCSVLCLVLMSLPLNSFAKIASFGEIDCETWINQPELSNISWAVGYISGVNASLSTEKNDILEKIKSEKQIWLYVDEYCLNNPTKTVANALHSLWNELKQNNF